MSKNEMKIKYEKDYKKPDYYVDTIHLTFELDNSRTNVKSVMEIKRNPNVSNAKVVLDACNLEFISAKINGEVLNEADYSLNNDSLIIHEGKNCFTLEIENYINPEENKALEGLYKSGNMFCTQNEPEGFRRITYYIDRPDVMAKFTTKIIADKKSFPVLLSNGNLIDSGDLEDGKHFATWFDPFYKPAYLYALVAGDLGMIRGTFKTKSDREIDLRIYCDKGNEDRCHFALESLKKAMKWDEETYGLEYDLDIFMIVAVDSFNMGAMENKGLNIFNSALVLADRQTATDLQFWRIEGVVGHEYFHNYTGNRITCRDWFQLTLKEGLTVFRDQEFSSDMNFRTVQRIHDVEALRDIQFAEDAGPTKHPIKPESFIEINNFYTPTIYDKGAEVIRMIHTLLGKEGFRKGIDKYFELFDGQAVTTNDFIHAMSVANNNYDFSSFEKSWYSQAGTPKLNIKSSFDKMKGEYKLNIRQVLSDHQMPYHMPYKIGLIDTLGNDIELTSDFLEIKDIENEFVFEGIKEHPYLSLNRDFSTPVISNYDYRFDEAVNLFKMDNNIFSRYEIHRKLAADIVLNFINNDVDEIPEKYIQAWGDVLDDESVDTASKALLISLPSESYIHQILDIVPYQKVFDGLKMIKQVLATNYEKKLISYYNNLKDDQEYEFIPKQVGKRDLKSEVLSYLMSLDNEKISEKCFNDFENATNMTDEYMAFHLLAHSNSKYRDIALTKFYDKWNDNSLVLMKWMAAIASGPSDDIFQRLEGLMKSKDYDKTVPNIIRAVLRSFGRNYSKFHDPKGRGYKLIADSIIDIDTFNPSISSGLSKLFMDFKKVPAENRIIMGKELYRIQKTENLSKNTSEIISKIL